VLGGMALAPGASCLVLILTARDRWTTRCGVFDAGAMITCKALPHGGGSGPHPRLGCRRPSGNAPVRSYADPERLDTKSGRVVVDGAQLS